MVLWRRLIASTFTSETQLRSWLGDLPVLAVIPAHPASVPRGPGSHAALAQLELAPRSGFAEAFRHLRANVYRSMPPRGGAVIMVTSPSTGDGKSTTCLALAAMLAVDGRRVVVVDGNPRQGEGGDIANTTGLGEALAGTARWNDAIVSVALVSGSFDFLPAGSSVVGGDLLSGSLFQALLGHIRSNYDVVIVEAPPFPALCDAFSLSSAVDAVFSVIRVRRSDRAAAVAHVDQLVHANPRYGVIINAAHTRSPTLVADTASGLWSYGAAPASARIAHGQSSGG
jgi:Mrp family chromosome partitioning ATPase